MTATRQTDGQTNVHGKKLHELHLQLARRLVQRVQIGVRHDCARHTNEINWMKGAHGKRRNEQWRDGMELGCLQERTADDAFRRRDDVGRAVARFEVARLA